jgi:hypothetical protein
MFVTDRRPDNFDFLLSGVPNLRGIQDAIPHLPDYDAESDTFDRVNRREEKATLAVASALCGRLLRTWNASSVRRAPKSRS